MDSRKKTNIWIINHYANLPSLGGRNRHFYFAKYLPRDKYDVEIFASSAVHNTDIDILERGEKFRAINDEGVDYGFLKTPKYKGNGISRIKNMLNFAWKIKKLPKYVKNCPDLIYATSPDIFTAHYAIKLARKLRVPIVIEIRDLWPESIVEYANKSRKNPLIKILYGLEKKIYKKADKLVFTMEGGKQYIIDNGWGNKIDLNKIYHINNGVDIERFDENIQQNSYDGIDEKKFNVTYCGSIRSANNVELIVQAAEILKDKAPDIKFNIFGAGDKKDELEVYCKTNVVVNVEFKGKVDNKYIPNILSKSSANLLIYKEASTWRYGGSQNKSFEYLASGKPIITNVKMGYSIFEKYKCGIESQNNAQSLADAIYDLYKMSSDDYNIFCENALNAAKDYDYRVLAEKFVNVVEA